MNGKTQTAFLRDFVEQEMYLQNPPLTTGQFITFCQKLGIRTTPDELESLEKDLLLFPVIRLQRPVRQTRRISFARADGSSAWADADYRLKQGERETGRKTVPFYAPYDVFQEDRVGLDNRATLLGLLDGGSLYDPAFRPFEPWRSFVAEELNHDNQRVISFYSSFQAHWLEQLQHALTITVTFRESKLNVQSSLVLPNDVRMTPCFSAASIDQLPERLHQIAAQAPFETYFDMNRKKEALRQSSPDFTALLRFLLSVQSVYFPYVTSGGRNITIRGDYAKWQQKRRDFDLAPILKTHALTIRQVTDWYMLFSKEARQRLGIVRDDWIQLWKQIAWEKKDALRGPVRLGVEYLQWAVMLKRVIEDHLHREILDIDEMESLSADDVLACVPDTMDQSEGLERGIRNSRYSDGENRYYHDRYKRLFYLANDFKLDYQPRVMVFVEGETEATVFPEIFERFTGQPPENLGVEFFNIQGVSRFFGQRIAIKKTSGKYERGFINNFNHLVSDNLNRWQIIPFFVGDNENDIAHLLHTGMAISFDDRDFPFPKEWQYIWGADNRPAPFCGKDFEMANFSDNEIADALSTVMGTPFKPSEIRQVRDAGNGIKQLGENVEARKIRIGKELSSVLFESDNTTKQAAILKRPIGEVMQTFGRLAMLNHPPVDRENELRNRQTIQRILASERSHSP